MASRCRQWFDTIDTDRNGEVDYYELHQALADGNLHFSLATVAHMIRLHKTPGVPVQHRRPRLNYPEFQQLYQFLQDTQTTFVNADTQKTGVLTYNQLAAMLKTAGYNFQQKLFDHVMEVFDPDGTQAIDLCAFIRLMMFLRSAGASFEAFDRQATGHIVLDFNQFLYAAANIL